MQSQRGVVLVVVLVMLLAITLLGVASLRSGIFYERMAQSSQTQALTFLGAESAINAILSLARKIVEEDAKQGDSQNESVLADLISGKTQINCISNQGITSDSCKSLSESFDSGISSMLFVEAESKYLGQFNVPNSDAEVLVTHQFSTIGKAYIRQDIKLPYATQNLQVWQKLGPAHPFSVSHQDVLSATKASDH